MHVVFGCSAAGESNRNALEKTPHFSNSFGLLALEKEEVFFFSGSSCQEGYLDSYGEDSDRPGLQL